MPAREPYDELSDEEIRIRIQALVDNELPEDEIEPMLERIQGSYEYRREYADLLRLRRKLASDTVPPLSEEWIDQAERRIARRITRGTGMVLFVSSYVGLLAYGLLTLFRAPDVPRAVLVLVAATVTGVAALLGNAIADRVRERKTDKYREIIR